LLASSARSSAPPLLNSLAPPLLGSPSPWLLHSLAPWLLQSLAPRDLLLGSSLPWLLFPARPLTWLLLTLLSFYNRQSNVHAKFDVQIKAHTTGAQSGVSHIIYAALRYPQHLMRFLITQSQFNRKEMHFINCGSKIGVNCSLNIAHYH
jgi:hypothetical protein